MASTKLSALTSASSLNSGDFLLLTQGGSSLKLDIQTMLKNLPVTPIVLAASEAPASGALSTLISVSKVTPAGAPTAYTLAAGTHGMTKTIVCTTFTSGTAVVTVTSGKGVSTITYNAVGDSCVLNNIDGFWYVVGSNSVTIA